MPTHYQGSDEEIRALNAYIRLTRAVDSMTGRLFNEPHLKGLTLTQLGVLDVLLHLGPSSPKEIARKILKSGGNLTLVMDNLEKRGLVHRERQAKDRRYVTVSLTESGRELIESVMPAHVADITRMMGVLSASEQDMLGELCKRLGLGLPAD